ncbi:MFS transporter [Streptomyces sp. MP131-18]|uniref:MFS transporter n=1 Tax=Streptomyces sp. MP131-18 TaxID=1857892 RepID=UPI00097CACA5|nr:MFS transporter [Streptomyces sp. MP131-18]ONK13761.1 putative MFS-type transporter YhjX [Streptomyces sp. MP131-18]
MTRTAAPTAAAARRRRTAPPRVHPAWWVAAVAFLVLIGAAGFRAATGVLIDPLHEEFGWSRGSISFAVSVNLLLYGFTAPFATALMERYGIRRVVAGALLLIAAGSGLTVFMTSQWQLVLCWGVLVGLGAGSMALAFAGTVAGRWFVARRGLVTGILTAGGAAGNLVFLPLVGILAEGPGWRFASLTIAACAVAVVPLVVWLLRDRPEDVGVRPYGAGADWTAPPPVPPGAARRTLRALARAARTRVFWLLAASFAICGASTNGLIGTHFVPGAHDHGMPVPVAASLLALIGIFDLVGTVCSGWLTDRYDARRLLAVYYGLRGLSLLFLPMLMAGNVHPPMLLFVVFYGLDWVATVPPTIALCREHFGADGGVVFGWVLASHQLGAALVAFGAGLVRDATGSYDLAWTTAGGLCAAAAILVMAVHRPPRPAA